MNTVCTFFYDEDTCRCQFIIVNNEIIEGFCLNQICPKSHILNLFHSIRKYLPLTTFNFHYTISRKNIKMSRSQIWTIKQVENMLITVSQNKNECYL